MRISLQNSLIKYKSSSLRIVYYHIISDKNPEYYFQNKALSIKEFKKQIAFLKKNYDIIKLEEALNLSAERKSFTNKLVITFDDGFKENYSVIAPILIDENISASFFFVTNCIDNKDLMWRNKILLFEKYKTDKVKPILDKISAEFGLPMIKKNQNIMQWSYAEWPMEIKENIVNRLWGSIMPIKLTEYLEDKQPYCTVSEIKGLSDAGFGIGAHSITHPIFSKLDYDSFSHEIKKSNEIIVSHTGKQTNIFSYPFGIRATKKFENKFHDENTEYWVLLGTKNRLNNYPENSKEWERDNIEFSFFQMKLRLLCLPIYRSLICK